MSEDYSPEQRDRVIENDARRASARVTLARGGSVAFVVLAFAAVALAVRPDVKLNVNISIVASITFTVTITLSVIANVAQARRNKALKKRAELAELRCEQLEAKVGEIEEQPPGEDG